MPTYEFENSAGERRTIVASIKDMPPEKVVAHSPVGRDGTWKWTPCAEHGIGDGPQFFTRLYEIANAHVRKYTTWRSPLTGGKIMDV